VETPSLPPGAEAKLRDIRSVTDAALSHLGADELLATLLSRVREILDADTAAVPRWTGVAMIDPPPVRAVMQQA
jgi:hypothetical protein